MNSAISSTAAGPRNPSYLAIDPQKRFIYAVQETEVDDTPEVHALAIEGHALRPLNSQPAHGGLPCHIVVDATGQCVLSANYETGSVAVYPIREDGSLGEASTVIQHKGSASNHKPKRGPHGPRRSFERRQRPAVRPGSRPGPGPRIQLRPRYRSAHTRRSRIRKTAHQSGPTALHIRPPKSGTPSSLVRRTPPSPYSPTAIACSIRCKPSRRCRQAPPRETRAPKSP